MSVKRQRKSRSPALQTAPRKRPAHTTPPAIATEVEAYGFIRENLRGLGWNVRSPSHATGGQVWTQNQCLSHSELKRAFGLKRPENVVKLSESAVWIIEAKSKRRQLAIATAEACGYYGGRLNDSPVGQVRAILGTGVAGSDEYGYLVRTRVWCSGA